MLQMVSCIVPILSLRLCRVMRNKTPCRAVPTRCSRIGRHSSYHRVPLAFLEQKGYTIPAVWRNLHCVGGLSTCSGVRELPLPRAAVISFSVAIATPMWAHINSCSSQKARRIFVKNVGPHKSEPIALGTEIVYDKFNLVGFWDWRRKMARTEAQLESGRKYHNEKLEEIKFRVPKGEKAHIQAHAAANGESTNAFIYRAVRETIAREKDV